MQAAQEEINVQKIEKTIAICHVHITGFFVRGGRGLLRMNDTSKVGGKSYEGQKIYDVILNAQGKVVPKAFEMF